MGLHRLAPYFALEATHQPIESSRETVSLRFAQTWAAALACLEGGLEDLFPGLPREKADRCLDRLLESCERAEEAESWQSAAREQAVGEALAALETLLQRALTAVQAERAAPGP